MRNHLTGRIPVCNDHSVPSPFIAEDVLEKPPVACRRNTVYLIERSHESCGSGLCSSLGGAGALMAASVEELEIICWEDLGCEAVRRLAVKDFPLTVILDPHGGNLYESGPAAYLNCKRQED